MRDIMARHHEHAGGSAIQSMHDARTDNASLRGQLSQAIQERVHQSSAGYARAGMDDHACGLVHHDQVIVFVQ